MVPVLVSMIDEAVRLHEDEASLRLVRIAGILGDFEGPKAIDALIDILATSFAEARVAAGQELEALSYDRFPDVALGIERALERLPVGSPALQELPHLLAEIPEIGVIKLLGKFLAHADPEAVVAAIEASVEVADPRLVPYLEALLDDERQVAVESDEADPEPVPLGELADEAIELILSDSDEGDDDGDDGDDEANDAPASEPPPPAPTPARGRGGRR